MKKLLFLISSIILISCVKEYVPEPQSQPKIKVECDKACLLSDKYVDSLGYTVWKQTDTIWPKRFPDVPYVDTVCGRWLDTIKVTIKRGEIWTDYANCPTPPNFPWLKKECLRYVLGTLRTYPKKF